MANEKHEEIRKLAYELWEREGRPHGRHEEHWQRAIEEAGVTAEEAGPAEVTTAPRRGRKPAAAAADGATPPRRGRKPAGSAAPAAPASRRRATGATADDGAGQPADPEEAKAPRARRTKADPDQPK